MPRLYLMPTELNSYPAGIALAGPITKLANLNTGAVEQILARASRRVDMFCKKRIGAPPQTTVGIGGINAGTTSLPVASTIGFDNGQEQAVLIGPPGAQEIVPVLPGGVQVTSWTSPYPGTLSLAASVLNTHAAGQPVQGLYQEVSTVGSSGSSDVYSESLLQLNQAAQLARAHAPQFDTSGLTRVIFLKCYPIVQLYRIEHMLPIDTTYETLDQSQVGIQPAAGYLRLPIGSFVLPEGLFRTTYTAGFQNIPDEIKDATACYFAAEMLAFTNPYGVIEEQQGKHRTKWTDGKVKPYWVQQAEDILNTSNYVRRT